MGIIEGIMGFDIYGIELYYIQGWSNFYESKRSKILDLEEESLEYFKSDYFNNLDKYNSKYKNLDEYLLDKIPMPTLHSGNCMKYIGQSAPINREPNVTKMCKDIIKKIGEKENLKNEAEVSEYLKIKYMNTIEADYQSINKAIDSWRLVNVYNNIDPSYDSNNEEEYYITKDLRKRYNKILAEKRSQIYSKLVERDEAPTRWGSESRLFKLVRKTYEDAIFQYHSEFLGLQSYDIFIPSIKVAIEYQGKQHYEPINFFGGEDAFKHRMKLDEMKKEISKNNGITLIEWKYNEPISSLRLKEKLKKVCRSTK